MAAGEGQKNAILRLQQVEEAKALEAFATARDALSDLERRHEKLRASAVSANEKRGRAEAAHRALAQGRSSALLLARSDAHLGKCRQAAEKAAAEVTRAGRELEKARSHVEESRSKLESSLRKRESLLRMRKTDDRKEAQTKVRRAESERDPWRPKKR